MSDLRKRVIKLAYEHPELRADLLPLIHKDAGIPDWMKALPRNAWSLIKKFVVHEIEQDLLNGPGSFDKVWGKVTKKVEKEVGKDEAKKLEKDRKTKKKFEDWAEKEQKKARLK